MVTNHEESCVWVSASGHSSSNCGHSKANDHGAASYVPGRLAQAGSPPSTTHGSCRAFCGEAFCKAPFAIYFSKLAVRHRATAKPPWGRRTKHAENQVLQRTHSSGTLHNSSPSRDSPAKGLQVTTSQHALCSARTHRCHFTYSRTNTEPKRLARNPADPPRQERGCFPRRPPDAANSFALRWARSALLREPAVPGRGEESPLSSRAPSRRSPAASCGWKPRTKNHRSLVRHERRHRAGPSPGSAAVPLPCPRRRLFPRQPGPPGRARALTPRASPPGSQPPAPPPSPGDADGRREPLPPRRRSLSGRRARAPREHADTRSHRPASRRRPMPLGRHRPAAVPRRLPPAAAVVAAAFRFLCPAPPHPSPGSSRAARPCRRGAPGHGCTALGEAAPPRTTLPAGARRGHPLPPPSPPLWLRVAPFSRTTPLKMGLWPYNELTEYLIEL
ncbi:serine/arginine repetitive matrix protein 1-like [Numida meleagris]|uniref:serine/arginine repetitive matrix protein 1-like n=1 Tax=Numida meleagris TaxID=8996 RepID=UPI000B3D8A3D|nr:serine/arginine repetitive matrix protein 1-like [Numida meleagris]